MEYPVPASAKHKVAMMVRSTVMLYRQGRLRCMHLLKKTALSA